MFTGIIQSKGLIVDIAATADGINLAIDLAGLDLQSIELGDSVAVNGVCLTVMQMQGSVGHFDVSTETLGKTLLGQWQKGSEVNLETAATLQTALGGHIVAGHVDGLAKISRVHDTEEYREISLTTAKSLGRLIAAKGSVTLNGVSLTSNRVDDEGDTTHFHLMLVPHTLAMTTLGALKAHDHVHLEIDLIARYVARMLDSQ